MKPINTNVILIGTFQAFFLAFLFSYFEVDIPIPTFSGISNWVPGFGTSSESYGKRPLMPDDFIQVRCLPTGELSQKYRCSHRSGTVWKTPDFCQAIALSQDEPTDTNIRIKKKSKNKGEPEEDLIVMTKKELSHYNGEKGSKGIYLALLGQIFDVKKGKKHYGPKGGYHFFSGRDATRAFITGEFNEKGLIDDISGLQHEDLLGLEDWLQFYKKDYIFVGYLQGTYYDSKGRPTAKLKKAWKEIEAAKEWKEGEEREAERFPPCNSEWSQGKGSRVWCSNKSGGITRDWTGVPRKMFTPGSSQSRCTCVKNSGPPQDGSDPGGKRGDLDHPNLQEYPNCHKAAISCTIKE